jgi:hypothetical protein
MLDAMTGEDLKSILESARPQLEAGLAAAESELQALEERRVELLALINQARAALGQTDVSPSSRADEPRLTLHEALALVLREGGNDLLTVRELTDQVNGRSLYRRRNGSPVEANQVHARIKNYPKLFEKSGSRVRLRDV